MNLDIKSQPRINGSLTTWTTILLTWSSTLYFHVLFSQTFDDVSGVAFQNQRKSFECGNEALQFGKISRIQQGYCTAHVNLHEKFFILNGNSKFLKWWNSSTTSWRLNTSIWNLKFQMRISIYETFHTSLHIHPSQAH